MNASTSTEFRDEELGAALLELDVPEHAAAFDAALHDRLAVQRLGGNRRRRRRTRRTLKLGIAAVVSIAVIFLLALRIPGTERTPRIAGPELATAAEIKAQVRSSLRSMRTLSGVLVFDGPERGDERRWRFALTARGDFRLAGPTDRELITYDAAAGVARSAQTSASSGGDAIFYAERRGVAPGPPDQGPPTWALPAEFGAFVRALLASDDPRVSEVTYEGRPAWRLDVDAAPNAIVPELFGDRLEITVDRETGIPVRVVERRGGGGFLREIRIEELEVDAALAANAFRLEYPAGAEVMRSDDGFRRVELAEVAGIVGRAPLVPGWIPDGYAPAEVAVATEAAPTGAEAGNLASRMVVSLSYRRGLDQFLVTARLAEPPVRADDAAQPRASWSDPLAAGEGFLDRAEPPVLLRGALAGVRAELVIVPRGIPHLWALTRELVVTVGGDLSRAELIRVAESLQRGG